MAKRFLTPIDLNKNELRNAVVQVLASEPSSPSEGQTYYDSVLKMERFYNGTAWVNKGGADEEAVEDIVAGLIVGTGALTATYNDATNTLTLNVPAAEAAYDDEAARDAIAAALTAGNNIDITVDDGGNTITIDVEGLTSADLSDFTTAVQAAFSVTDTATLDLTKTGGAISGTVLDSPTVAGQTPANLRDRSTHTGTQSADSIVDGTTNKAYTATEKTKLAGIATGATANSSDATLLARANHTGTQASTTISDFAEAVSDQVGTMITGNTETGITVTYDDADNTLDFVVTDSPTVAGATPAQLRDRATHTGTQTAATISDFNTAVRTNRLDQMAAPTAAVAMGSQKITGLADGTVATDAATFGQLNAILQGQTWKAPVRIASTGNLGLTGLAAIDGVTPVAGDRILAKDQSAPAANGIYVAAAGAWSRSTDADAAAELNNATVLIEEGTVGAGDIYTQTATVVTLGTTGQTWQKVGEGNTVYAADGTTITLTGTTFGVSNGGITGTQLNASVAGAGLTGGGGSALAVGAGTGITVNANDVAITAAGVTETQLAASVAGGGLTGGAGTALAVGAGTGITVNANDVAITAGGVTATQLATSVAGAGLTGGGGTALAVGAGTGITVNADDIQVNTAVVVRKYATAIAGTTTSEVITHNLNTQDVTVGVYLASGTFEEVECDIEHTSVNTITLRFATAPTAGQYRVVVHG